MVTAKDVPTLCHTRGRSCVQLRAAYRRLLGCACGSIGRLELLRLVPVKLPPGLLLTTQHHWKGGGGGLFPHPPPPPPERLGQNFFRAFGQSTILSDAFGASKPQLHPRALVTPTTGAVRKPPLSALGDLQRGTEVWTDEGVLFPRALPAGSQYQGHCVGAPDSPVFWVRSWGPGLSPIPAGPALELAGTAVSLPAAVPLSRSRPGPALRPCLWEWSPFIFVRPLPPFSRPALSTLPPPRGPGPPGQRVRPWGGRGAQLCMSGVGLQWGMVFHATGGKCLQLYPQHSREGCSAHEVTAASFL